ncbi:MAG: OsmC family peroxiredoxin [Bacteroidia bacterium]
MKRHATAVWLGSGKEGSGHLTTQSTVLNKTQYSWSSRFADGIGTNPEELLAAAHAGCFTMKVTFVLGAAGFTPMELETQCTITLEDGKITGSHLELTAKIKDISQEQFEEAVRNAEENCLVSHALNTKITVQATLNS